jgi:hypothetical protein
MTQMRRISRTCRSRPSGLAGERTFSCSPTTTQGYVNDDCRDTEHTRPEAVGVLAS